MDTVYSGFHHLFTPSAPTELAVFYFLWVCIFLFVNVVWDIMTKKTDKFHIRKLKDKTAVLHSAAFFSSSLLLIVAVFNDQIWAMAKETYIPVILAGLSGILSSIPSLCPYET